MAVAQMHLLPAVGVLFAIVATLALPTISFAQVKVIIFEGFAPAYREFFRSSSGRPASRLRLDRVRRREQGRKRSVFSSPEACLPT